METADLATFIEEIFNGKLHFFAVWDFKLKILYGSLKDSITYGCSLKFQKIEPAIP